MEMLQTGVPRTARITLEDASGNPATVDGLPEWASSDPRIAAVVPAPDGMSAIVTPGLAGECQISVTVDADLGDGVKPIVGEAAVRVLSGEVTRVAIAFDPA